MFRDVTRGSDKLVKTFYCVVKAGSTHNYHFLVTLNAIIEVWQTLKAEFLNRKRIGYHTDIAIVHKTALAAL